MVVKSDYPDTQTRERVKTLIGIGVPVLDVCALTIDPDTGVAITLDRLNAVFAEEIATAAASANAQILAALYKAATGGGKEAVKAALHWVSTHQQSQPLSNVDTKPQTHKSIPKAIKRQVVIMFAQGMFVSEIQRVLRDEHGLDVTQQALTRYNPHTRTGSKMSAELKELYEHTRAKAIEDLESLDYAYRPTRVRALERELERAVDKGDGALATRVLAQLAVEMQDIELINIDPPGQAPAPGEGGPGTGPAGGNSW